MGRQMTSSGNRTIKVDYLARVEGEGGLSVRIRDGQVQDLKLRIFEPPRFFEGFLRGRHMSEAPDITARICGICPVAYQMSAAHAMEQIVGARVEGPLRDLRRLLYCGEWIESHALHIFMLHAPDFLGFDDAIALARVQPDLVKDALRIKKLGNELMILIGGREIHPISARVGGFYSAPGPERFEPMVEPLQWALETMRRASRTLAGLEFPDFEQDYEFVSLRHEHEYPLCEGRLVSNKGLDIAIEDFDAEFEEEQAPHSTSLRSRLRRRGIYHVGPLARFNLNFDKLTPAARETALELGIEPPLLNPFKSILARAVETIFAIEESLRIIGQYEPPASPFVPVTWGAGVGHGCTEAPRGFLYHRYRTDEEGLIQDARIVPPTAQNQLVIESDLREFVTRFQEDPLDRLTWKCEQAIRNYDPCISCSCHFLKLDLDRA